MKLKYTLGAFSAVFALTGCSLDVNMYDGVTGEDVNRPVTLWNCHKAVTAC